MKHVFGTLFTLTGLLGNAFDDSIPFERLNQDESLLLLILDLPVIMTTSAQQGPNAILDMYPDAPLIQRQGEVDAWDNAEFRAAVRAANKSQIIMAEITTDVCNTFLALSLREEGFSV